MPRTLKELQDARATLATEIKKRADEFNANGKKFVDGEAEKNWQKLNKDYDDTMAEIDEAKRADTVASRLAQIEEHNRAPINPNGIGLDDAGDGRVGGRQAPGGDGASLSTQQAAELAFDGWCRHQYGIEMSREQRRAVKQLNFPVRSKQLNLRLPAAPALNSLRNAWLAHHEQHRGRRPFEYNAPLSGAIGSSGRYTIAPETLVSNLEVNMLAFGGVRQVAEQILTSHGEPFSWPTVDDTSNEGRELPENTAADDNAGTGTSGDGGPNPAFGKSTWNAYKYTSDAILVPYELMEDTEVPLNQIIGAMLGERLGRVTNRRFTLGTGASQPLGIVTGATLGVTTASASAITFEEVIDLEHSVDIAYRDGAGYMLPDLVLAHLRKLKGSDGHPIWQAHFNTGAPDTLNNRPYTVNNHMATIAASAAVMLFGQLSKYKIRRVNAVRIYRLEERYRNKDQDGFVAFVREDGGPLNAGTAPIKKLVMHA